MAKPLLKLKKYTNHKKKQPQKPAIVHACMYVCVRMFQIKPNQIWFPQQDFTRNVRDVTRDLEFHLNAWCYIQQWSRYRLDTNASLSLQNCWRSLHYICMYVCCIYTAFCQKWHMRLKGGQLYENNVSICQVAAEYYRYLLILSFIAYGWRRWRATITSKMDLMLLSTYWRDTKCQLPFYLYFNGNRVECVRGGNFHISTQGDWGSNVR